MKLRRGRVHEPPLTCVAVCVKSRDGSEDGGDASKDDLPTRVMMNPNPSRNLYGIRLLDALREKDHKGKERAVGFYYQGQTGP